MYLWMGNINIFHIVFISCTLFFVTTEQHNHVNCADGDVIKCNNMLRAMRVDKRAEESNNFASDDDKGSRNIDIDQDSLQELKHGRHGDNDRLSDLLDLNSEPAVEDLMRQIMSQAKLWEAIQEANREMVIQKDQRAANGKDRFPLAFNAQ